MPKQKLTSLLEELSTQLSEADGKNLSEADKTQLHEVLAAVESKLSKWDEPAGGEDEHHSLKENVENSFRKLEGSHPTFAAVLRQITEVLSQSGI